LNEADTLMSPQPSPTPSAKTSRSGLKLVYLSLGSNLGNRLDRIRGALAELDSRGIKVRHVSSFYKTQPVDFLPQPWFLNCAAEAETALMPMQLLRAVKAVERAIGRRPGVEKGPRVIDIDILLYENVVVRSPTLTIPHARLQERRFVLVPLEELAPELRHPVDKRTVSELLHASTDRSQVIRFKGSAAV